MVERLTNKVEVTDDEGPAAPAAPKAPAPKAEEGDDQRRSPPKKEAADGKGYVEIKDDALKARFNHLYRTTKEAQERAARTERAMAALHQQNEKLFKAVQELTSRQKDKETQAELSTLRAEAENALATGDTKTFTQVNERLTEIKAEAIATKKADKEEEGSGEEERREAPPITEAELSVLAKWQRAKDPETGELVRPWAIPGHDEFEAAQDMLRRVSASEKYRDAPVREILAEVDRRMARVLGQDDEDEAPRRRGRDSDEGDDDDGNAVRRAFSSPQGRPVARQRDRDGLSAEERKVAESMFLGGRGAPAKNAKEAHELYLNQKRALSRVVAVED